MEKMGIAQLSYFVRFFGGLIAIVVGIIKAGKISLLKDIQKLFRLLTLIRPLFSNFGQVWDEFRDLDESEKDELETILAIELDLEFGTVEEKEIVQKGLMCALTMLQFISEFKKA